MIQRSGLRAAALLAFLFAVQASFADTILRQEIRYSMKRGVETPSIDEQVYYLASDRARVDLGSVGHLVDTRAGELYHLDLDDRTFHTLPSPYALAKVIPAHFLEQAQAQAAQRLPKTIEVVETGETDTLHGYPVRRVRIEAGGPGEPLTARMDLWVSEELWKELAETAYWELERDRLAAAPYSSWLVEPLAALKAVPLESRSSIELSNGRLRSEYVRVTTAIEHVEDLPPETLRVPEGFTEVPVGLQ